MVQGIRSKSDSQLIKKFPSFDGTRKFFTVLTRSATGPFPKSGATNPQFSTLFP